MPEKATSDEYLREAASIPHTPSGTIYQQGGKPLEQPLGLFEHWNSDHPKSETPFRVYYP